MITLEKESVMARANRRKKEQQESLVLVDGYYIPAEIKDAYIQLKHYCIDELIEELSKTCHHVGLENDGEYVFVYGEDEEHNKRYVIELSPIKISQIEKAIGTKKLADYIKEYENG
ncbi:hypothetical protein KG089_04815 [Carnobacteriaceae bacterium zg-ZUI252]|nr:hypothetical protein [Carnobacteriaceae bacterium zg-ZUI252]QTU82707.1 hypothetical protein J7S27_05270 [Carnobacteriaceae bacterium zg-C25]